MLNLTDPNNASLKRFGAFLVTAGIVAINKKLGLGLDAADLTALTTLTLGYIGQSAWKEQAVAKADAARQEAPPVKDAAEAVAVLKGGA